MTDFNKINRPPAAEHWSRMQHPEVNRTAKRLIAFLRGSVTWNYQATRNAARYYIEDAIDRETAQKTVAMKGNPAGRPHNRDAVDAFFDYVENFPIRGVPAFTSLVEWFPIGPDAKPLPIRPLSVTREGGLFVPNFLNPWSEIAFDSYQASLYMTILERSVFRLTDFEDSPGRIIFLPKWQIGPREWKRKAVIWTRGQFPLLSDRELNDQIRIFIESKEIASKWFREHFDSKKKQ
ncbi:hypothetical protein [Pseudotabrizicola sp. L79]|uniref:hypothetical protein n=1 Tax=Pseudotabrizicola sp. L79 TaxID=3118402 RepID=UPI002F954265